MPAAKYPKIVVTPPGPKARALLKEDESLISPSLVRFYPLAADSGQGCIVKDVDGNEFIDFNSGLVCLAVGHSHPKVVGALRAQPGKLFHHSCPRFCCEKVGQLSKERCR